MNEFDLRFISPDDRSWQDFVQCQPDLNIFHSQNWLRLLETCYGFHPFIMAMCDSTGTIRAGLPMMDVKHAFGKRRWISLPFSDYSVPLLSESGALGSFTDLIKSSAEKPSTPATEIRWDFSNENTHPDYVLHTLSLEPDFGKVSRGIHHSHLRNVRTAQANGIQIRHGTGREEISAFYELHLQTRRRQGVPIQPRDYFTQLGELILKKGMGFISLAYHDSTCLAGAVFLHWKNTLTYKYGASTEAGLPLRPNHLLFYDAIQWGCENGYTLLDFGRSDLENEGLRVFKSRWGAIELPLRYSNFPPEEQSSSQTGLFMSMAGSLIRNSPTWMCRLAGEIYYRWFG